MHREHETTNIKRMMNAVGHTIDRYCTVALLLDLLATSSDDDVMVPLSVRAFGHNKFIRSYLIISKAVAAAAAVDLTIDFNE